MRLRELRRQDLGELNGWRNDRDVVDGLGAPFAFIGPEIDDAWFSAYLGSRHRNVRLAIVDDDDKLVGCSYLLDISWVHRSAEFAIMIGAKDRWKRGLGSAATSATLDHAFLDLQLHRVWLHVNSKNEAAKRVYSRAGFKLEGTLRRAVFKNGSYGDVELMAVLAADHVSQGRGNPG